MTYHKNRHISRLLKLCTLGVFWILGASSCESEPAHQDEGSTVKCELFISLSVGKSETDNQNASRAEDNTWGNTNKEQTTLGTEEENSINSIDLYLVTNNNNRLRIYRLSPDKQIDGLINYRIKVDLDKDMIVYEGNKRYISGRIEAFVNTNGSESYNNPLEARLFNSADIVNEGKVSIPMWGVTTLHEKELEWDSNSGNWCLNAGEINVLRAIPKVTFQLDTNFDEEFIITEITSTDNCFVEKGFYQPNNWETAEYTEDITIEGCFNPVEGDCMQNLPFYGIETSKVSLYIPECKITTPTGNDSMLGFNLIIKRKSSEDYSNPGEYINGTVYLCDYEDGIPKPGTAFDKLIRNHDYQYIISLTPIGLKIDFYEWKFGGKVHIDLEE